MGSFASTHPYNGGIARPVCSDRSSSALDVALTDVTTHWCRPLMTTDIRFSRQQIVPSVHATVHGCDWLLKFRVRDPCRKICIETIATTSQRRKNTRFIACEVFCRWNLQSKSHYSMFGKEHVLFFACLLEEVTNEIFGGINVLWPWDHHPPQTCTSIALTFISVHARFILQL